MNDVALYIKTENSLLSSLIRIPNLIQFAKQHNIKALAITDDSLYGTIEFYHACKKENIKPIIGMAITIEEKEIILYAKNYQGYQNLLKLETIRSERNLSLIDLETYKNHLVCIVPYEAMIYYDALATFYPDIFKAYSTKEQKDNLTGNNLIFARPVLYLTPEEKETYIYLSCIKDGSILTSKQGWNPNNHFLLRKQIEEVFPMDRQNNEKIYDMCNLTIETNKNLLPIYPCPDHLDSYSYLKKLCIEGLKRIFGEKAPKIYQERVKYELSIIEKMGFCNYFLVVWDYVKYAKENDILVGPGRGSAAGSLVSYLLNITTVDPIRYQLLFERFLNPMRVTMPDIDIGATRSILKRYCTI